MLKLKSILFLSAVVALATGVKLVSGVAGAVPVQLKVEARVDRKSVG